MSKILMVVNEDRFFLSHRKPIAMAAKDKGLEIIIVAKDTGYRTNIEHLGLKLIDLPINPTGMNLKEEWKTFKFLYHTYKKHKPDIVHHVGLKSMLWGGIASKLTHVNGVVNAVSGLGGLFTKGKMTIKTRAILNLIGWANSRQNIKVIFQNNDDKSIMLSHHDVKKSQIEFTKGSGIDLNDFKYTPEPHEGKIKIIFTARMVKEKGVMDLIEAAEILKDEYKDKVEFLLCGRLTPNKTGVTEEYLSSHCDGVYIQWLGERNDVKDLLEKSHIMAFPSYYREGVPKSLIEASAIGRPIVTCDSTGCRDVVVDGVNGYLVKPQNPKMLADRIKILIDDKSKRETMGKSARKRAEAEFSIQKVVDTHMRIYEELLEYNQSKAK